MDGRSNDGAQLKSELEVEMPVLPTLVERDSELARKVKHREAQKKYSTRLKKERLQLKSDYEALKVQYDVLVNEVQAKDAQISQLKSKLAVQDSAIERILKAYKDKGALSDLDVETIEAFRKLATLPGKEEKPISKISSLILEGAADAPVKKLRR